MTTTIKNNLIKEYNTLLERYYEVKADWFNPERKELQNLIDGMEFTLEIMGLKFKTTGNSNCFAVDIIEISK